jgi:hypothetical protein
MTDSTNSIYLQPIVITSVPEPHEISVPGEYPLTEKLESSVAAPITLAPGAERQILRQTFSNVPIITQIELSQEYRELGEVLTEMTEFDKGDDWKIEAPVFHAARYVAAVLMDSSYPAPRVFNHGPRSVVFNWPVGAEDNLYLTISADKLSALVSSPERIKRRMDFSANEPLTPALVLVAFQGIYSGRPILLISGAAPDPLKLITE